MTSIKIKRKSEHIVVVESDGHTGYGVEGEDIVCAAVSSIIQTALLGLMRVAGLDVKFHRDEQKGYLRLEVAENLSPRDRNNADMILETMLCGLADLFEGYSDFIELEA